jgi:voltage-gated potassium channel
MARGGHIKEIEEFPRRLKIFFWVILILFLIGTAGFLLIDKLTISDSFLRTLQTLAFVFEDDSSIYERLLEIFLAIVGVFLVWWVLWSIADMILDGNLKKYLKARLYNIKLKSMKDHVIIAGGGRIGEEVARVLTEKKEKFVINDFNPEVARELRKKNYIVVEGNAEHEEILLKAEIKSAKKLILALPKTKSNVLITLTAKELNPNIEIYAVCENSKYVSKLKRAGAKVAIVPEIVAGDKLAESMGF